MGDLLGTRDERGFWSRHQTAESFVERLLSGDRKGGYTEGRLKESAPIPFSEGPE